MAEKLSGNIGSENVRLEYSSKSSLDDIYKQLEAQTKLLEKCCGRGPSLRQTGGGTQTGAGVNSVQQAANSLGNKMGVVTKAFGLLGSAISGLTKFTIGAVTGLAKFAAAIGGAILDGLLGLAQAFGSLLSWANDTNSSLSQFTQSIFNVTKTLTSNIPLIGGALTTLVATIEAVFQPVYQILEQNISAFQKLNQAGIDLGSGLMSAKTAAIQAGMGLDDFTSIIRNNSDKLAAFGGDASTGAQRFADIMGRAFRSGTGPNLAKLGFTAAESAEYLTSYLDQQRALGNVQGKSNEELAQGAQTYLKELDKLARVTGMSRQDAQRALDQQRLDMSLNAKLLTLQPQAQTELKKLIAAFEKAGPGMGDALRDIVKFDGNPITEAGQALATYAPSLVRNSQALMNGQMSAEQALAELDKDAEKQIAQLRAQGKSAAEIAAMGNKFEEVRIAVANMAGQFKNAIKVSADQQKALEDGDKALAGFRDAMTEIKNAIFSFLSGTGIFEIATEYMSAFVSVLRSGAPEVKAVFESIVTEFRRVFGISDKKEKGEKVENKMLQVKETIINGLRNMIPYIQKLKDFFDKVTASFKQGMDQGGIWGGIKAAFGTIMSPLWESLKSTLVDFWNQYSPTVIAYLKDAFKNVMQLFGSIALDGLKRMPGLIWDGIKYTMKELWGAITGAIAGWFAGASIGGLIGGVVGSFFGPLGTAIGSQVGGIIGSWFGAIGGGLIGDGLQGIIEFLFKGLRTAWNVVSDLVAKGVDGIKSMFITFIEEIQLWIASMMKYIPGLRDKGKELEASIQKDREQRAGKPESKPEKTRVEQLEERRKKFYEQGPATNSPQQQKAFDNILMQMDREIERAKEEERQKVEGVPQASKGGLLTGPDEGYLAKLHGTEFVINEKDLKGRRAGDVDLKSDFNTGLPTLADTTNSLIKQYLKLEDQLTSLALIREPKGSNTYVDIDPETQRAQDRMYIVFDNLKERLEGFGINITKLSSDLNKAIDADPAGAVIDFKKYSLAEPLDNITKSWTDSVQQSLTKKNDVVADINSRYKDDSDVIPKLVNQLQSSASDKSDATKDGNNNLATAMNELNSKLAVLIDLQSENNKIADNQLNAVQSYSGDLFKAL